MIRLSREQVRSVDRICIEEYRLPGIVLMENAARSVVDIVGYQYPELDGPALVVCGGGNNGGDGYAIARLLANRGHAVTILAMTPHERLTGDARIMADVTRAMRLPAISPSADEIGDRFAIVFDCLFGTGLNKPPSGAAVDAIAAINRRDQRSIVVAIDVPSGLDCDSGHPLGATVEADLTVTFVAEKRGFANPSAREYLGDVLVGDIGCPREVIDRVSQM